MIPEKVAAPRKSAAITDTKPVAKPAHTKYTTYRAGLKVPLKVGGFPYPLIPDWNYSTRPHVARILSPELRLALENLQSIQYALAQGQHEDDDYVIACWQNIQQIRRRHARARAQRRMA